MRSPLKKLLVATDFSSTSRSALRFARDLAAKLEGSIELVNVSKDPRAETWVTLSGNSSDHAEGITKAARSELARLRDEVLVSEDLADAPLHARVGNVSEQVLAVAAKAGADVIVCGATGTTRLKALFFGATASRLVRQSSLPVLIVPDAEVDSPPDVVLAPIDMSETSRLSLKYAATIAAACGAELVVLHATIAPPAAGDPFIGHLAKDPVAWRAELDAKIEAFVSETLPEGSDFRVLVHTERPAEAILAAARDTGADLICMGTHGRAGIARFQLGNTAERLLRHAPCPVLTINPRGVAT